MIAVVAEVLAFLLALAILTAIGIARGHVTLRRRPQTRPAPPKETP